MRITQEQGERILTEYGASEGLDFDPECAYLTFYIDEDKEDSY